jgi:hypothetical protein
LEALAKTPNSSGNCDSFSQSIRSVVRFPIPISNICINIRTVSRNNLRREERDSVRNVLLKFSSMARKIFRRFQLQVSKHISPIILPCTWFYQDRVTKRYHPIEIRFGTKHNRVRIRNTQNLAVRILSTFIDAFEYIVHVERDVAERAYFIIELMKELNMKIVGRKDNYA